MMKILDNVWLNSTIGLSIIIIMLLINVILMRKQTTIVSILNQSFACGLSLLFGWPCIIYSVLSLSLLIFLRYRNRYIKEGSSLDFSGRIFSLSSIFNRSTSTKKDEIIVGKILPINRSELSNNLKAIKLNDQILSGALLITGSTGSGKAEPNSTDIPVYDDGKFIYKKMGDLQPGDYVYNRLGKPVKILDVYPQGKLDIYEMTLCDGRSIKLSGNHLITYKSGYGNGSKNWKTVELQSLIDKVKSGNFVIPANQPVQTKPIQYSVSPYVVGAFLGNGCKSHGELTFSSGNTETPSKISSILSQQLKCNIKEKRRIHNYTYYFYKEGGSRVYAKDLTSDDNLIDLLANTYSYNKYIPFEYKFGSIEQRWELIQGLFDTDGTISIPPRYNISYSSTSKQLINDIQEVLYSLGIASSITMDTRKRPCYQLHIKCNACDKQKFFTLSSKLERAHLAPLVEKDRVKKFGDVVIIKSIEKLGYKEDCTCIYVDDEEHLYQGENFVVTHNTTGMKSIMKQAIHHGKPVVFVDYKGETEMLDELQEYCSQKGVPYYEFSSRTCTFSYDPFLNLNETGKVEALMHTRRWDASGADEHYKTSTQLAIQNIVRAYDQQRQKTGDISNYLVGLQKFTYGYKPESNERDGFLTLQKQLEILLSSRAKDLLSQHLEKFSFERDDQYVICFSFISANKALANSLSSFIFQDLMDRGTRRHYNPKVLLCVDEFGTLENSTVIKDILEKGRSGGIQTVFSILDINQIADSTSMHFVQAILGTINSFIIYAGATQQTADLLAGVQKYDNKGYSIMDLRKPYGGKPPTCLIISKFPLLSKKGTQEMYRIIPYIFKDKKSVKPEEEQLDLVTARNYDSTKILLNGEPLIDEHIEEIIVETIEEDEPMLVHDINEFL